MCTKSFDQIVPLVLESIDGILLMVFKHCCGEREIVDIVGLSFCNYEDIEMESG